MESSSRHKKAGFTFIEIVAALLVFSFLSTAIFVSQGSIVQRAHRLFDSFQAVVGVNNIFVQLDRDGRLVAEEGKENKIEIADPVPLRYEMRKISEKSALKDFEHAALGFFEMQKTATGPIFIDRQLMIVTLPLKPEEPSDKEKEKGKATEKTARSR